MNPEVSSVSDSPGTLRVFVLVPAKFGGGKERRKERVFQGPDFEAKANQYRQELQRQIDSGTIKSMTEPMENDWQNRLPGQQYKLTAANQFGIDVLLPDQLDIDEGRMSVVIPFADGRRRDGVGDLLEVGGIRTERHQANPICLFDHGKSVTLPIALAEDPDTKAYTVTIDPVAQQAHLKAFFYQGTGMNGVDRARESDHAVFCEQLFDMTAKRFLRAGSIGYQVVKAMNLQPDYERGTPAGLHLLSILMLEGSLVVLPANQDTVRKMLCMPKVCGKPLSPYLVKSLAPYAPARKAQMGYEHRPSQSIEPYNQGYQEAENDFPRKPPFANGTPQAVEWLRGYDDCKAGRPERKSMIPGDLDWQKEEAAEAEHKGGIPAYANDTVEEAHEEGRRDRERGAQRHHNPYQRGTPQWQAWKDEMEGTPEAQEARHRWIQGREKAQPSAGISPEKARQILKDGEVHGHPLTDKQRGMFGAAAGRGKSIKELRLKHGGKAMPAEAKRWDGDVAIPEDVFGLASRQEAEKVLNKERQWFPDADGRIGEDPQKGWYVVFSAKKSLSHEDRVKSLRIKHGKGTDSSGHAHDESNGQFTSGGGGGKKESSGDFFSTSKPKKASDLKVGHVIERPNKTGLWKVTKVTPRGTGVSLELTGATRSNEGQYDEIHVESSRMYDAKALKEGLSWADVNQQMEQMRATGTFDRPVSANKPGGQKCPECGTWVAATDAQGGQCGFCGWRPTNAKSLGTIKVVKTPVGIGVHYREPNGGISDLRSFGNAKEAAVYAEELANKYGVQVSSSIAPTGPIHMSGGKSLQAKVKYITHSGDKWVVRAESGKVLGTHDSKADAERQLRAVEANKGKSLVGRKFMYSVYRAETKYTVDNFPVEDWEYVGEHGTERTNSPDPAIPPQVIKFANEGRLGIVSVGGDKYKVTKSMKSLNRKVKMSHETAESQGLEPVFSRGHQYSELIFYDPKEGKYYDASTDMYITLDQARSFGLKSLMKEDTARWNPREILQLSSGTVSHLAGSTNYDAIDRFQGEFYEAVVNSGRSFSSWQDAWNWYKTNRRNKAMGYSELQQLLQKRASQAYQARREAQEAKPSKKQALMDKVYKMEGALDLAREYLGGNDSDTEKEEKIKAVLMEGFFKSIKGYANPLSNSSVPPAKWRPGVGAIKHLRQKHRPTKGLRRRLRKSVGGSSVIHVAAKDLESLKSFARKSGLTVKYLGTHANGSERVKLMGDDAAMDGVAKQFAVRRR